MIYLKNGNESNNIKKNINNERTPLGKWTISKKIDRQKNPNSQ